MYTTTKIQELREELNNATNFFATEQAGKLRATLHSLVAG